MNCNVKIAFCTDFSENAGRALESLLFNTWDYKVDFDVLHMVEQNYQESLEKLSAINEELKLSLNDISKVRIQLFREHQRDDLIEQLNNYGYLFVSIGLQGNGKGDGLGSFIKTLYREVDCNVMMVPLASAIKIENKVLVAVQSEHIPYLNLLKKFYSFFRFNFFKLTIVVRTLKEFAEVDKLKIQEEISEMLPNLEIHLIFHNPENYHGNLLKQLIVQEFGYFYVFKDSYYDKLLKVILETHPDKSILKIKVTRLMISERELELVKSNSPLLQKFELRYS